MNINRKVGNEFEKDLCRSLAESGFWCHNLAQNSQGQPFDVIAARNGVSYPIDCKDCSKNIFKLERIEENQASAMCLWKETGNGNSWFALRLMDGSVYFVSFLFVESCRIAGINQLSGEQIRKAGIPYWEWVFQCI